MGEPIELKRESKYSVAEGLQLIAKLQLRKT